MSEIVLLGAGASKEADLPTSYDLTKKIIEKFEDKKASEYVRISNFIIGGILFQEGINGNNPLEAKVNVEDFFNAVQLLANRRTLEVAPFLGSWHSKVEEFDKIYYNSWGEMNFIESLAKIILEFISKNSLQFGTYPAAYSYSPSLIGPDIGILDRLQLNDSFRRDVENILPKSGEGEVYRNMTESMIRILTDILWIGQERDITYLYPLINQTKSTNRLVIATLNYDNTIETAANALGIQCETCIDAWSKTGNFEIADKAGLILLKLHGSLDWERIRNEPDNDQLLPQTSIRKVIPTRMKDKEFWPAVLFGQRNKLTSEGPFLDILKAFQEELLKSTTLTIVGYSFGDDHINEYISQWLNQSNKHRIRIVDPLFDKNPSKFAVYLRQARKSHRKQFKILKKPASKGLDELYKATESSGARI